VLCKNKLCHKRNGIKIADFYETRKWFWAALKIINIFFGFLSKVSNPIESKLAQISSQFMDDSLSISKNSDARNRELDRVGGYSTKKFKMLIAH
jgi:hypothetical protein